MTGVQTCALPISDLRIGSAPEGHSSHGYFEGIIDEVRVWHVARTESEIQAAKESELSGSETGLVLYLNANEGSGNLLADSSGQGHDGVIQSRYGLADGVIAGRISHSGQQDHYAFTLSEAKQFYFDSLTNNGNLNWSLTGPRGVEVDSNSFTAQDWGLGLLELPLGDYSLTVDGSGDHTGAYSFRLIDLTSATAIIPGTVVSGQLNPASETDIYQFDALAGDQFYFDHQVSSYNTHWRLIDQIGRASCRERV